MLKRPKMMSVTNIHELLCLEDFYKCFLFGSSQKPFNLDRNWFYCREMGSGRLNVFKATPLVVVKQD